MISQYLNNSSLPPLLLSLLNSMRKSPSKLLLLGSIQINRVVKIDVLEMPCFVPFDNKKLDISFFVFRPTGVFADELIDAMKYLSFHAEDLGCVYSSVLKSMHGSLIVWYGAWLRRSPEDRQILNNDLLSFLREVSTSGVLINHAFFEAFFGEAKDGSSKAKFSRDDVIFLSAMSAASRDTSNLAYAMLALHRSFFSTAGGVSAGVYLQCREEAIVSSLLVWRSLGDCYSWLLQSDYRKSILPYFSHLCESAQFDVFKVVYVSSDEVVDIKVLQPRTVGTESCGISRENFSH